MAVFIIPAGFWHLVQHEVAKTQVMKIVAVTVFRQDPGPGITDKAEFEKLRKFLPAYVSAIYIFSCRQVCEFLCSMCLVIVSLQMQRRAILIPVQMQQIHEKLLDALPPGLRDVHKQAVIVTADHIT